MLECIVFEASGRNPLHPIFSHSGALRWDNGVNVTFLQGIVVLCMRISGVTSYRMDFGMCDLFNAVELFQQLLAFALFTGG